MVEHIASQNSEIISWVEFRRKQGQPVSQKVEGEDNVTVMVVQV